jgi:hypothetical protein
LPAGPSDSVPDTALSSAELPDLVASAIQLVSDTPLDVILPSGSMADITLPLKIDAGASNGLGYGYRVFQGGLQVLAVVL